jgi:hypothetical protein
VFWTRDDGRSWFKLDSPPDADLLLTGVVFPEPTRGIAIGWRRIYTINPITMQKEATGEAIAKAYLIEFDMARCRGSMSAPHPILPRRL